MNQAAKVQEAKGPLVWLDMDQKGLDDAYDQLVYAPNRDQIHTRNQFNSDRVRARLGQPKRIAQVFKEMTRDPDTVDTIAAILKDPVNVYDFTPRGIMQVASFMNRTGQLKTPPKDWRDTTFPELHDLPGS